MPTEEWTKTWGPCVCTHNEYYSAMKNETMPSAITRMNSETVTLSEMEVRQRQMPCVISYSGILKTGTNEHIRKLK